MKFQLHSPAKRKLGRLFLLLNLGLLLSPISCNTTNKEDSIRSKEEAKQPATIDTAITQEAKDTSWEYLDENEALPTPEIPKFSPNKTAQPLKWKHLVEGLDYTIADAPIKCSIGDSKIRIVRVDANKLDLKLLAVNNLNTNEMQSAKTYCQKYNLVGAINTSMFSHTMASVGYMKTYNQVNNGNLNKDKSIIAFHPKQKGTPAFNIIDLGCDDWEEEKDKYHSYIQNIRMIDCQQNIKWSKQEKFWSTACLGMDGKGRALFIHTRSPYRVHDLCRMLLQLPIDLKRCCYLEGGPESTLYLNYGGIEINSFGSYETDFNEDDLNNTQWQIPNVLGFTIKNTK